MAGRGFRINLTELTSDLHHRPVFPSSQSSSFSGDVCDHVAIFIMCMPFEIAIPMGDDRYPRVKITAYPQYQVIAQKLGQMEMKSKCFMLN